MPVETSVLDVRINNISVIAASITADVDRVDVTTRFEPDPDWISKDSADHMHGFTADGKLPTLNRLDIHEDCTDETHEDGCEGWDRPEYHCLVCDEIVKPQMRETRGRRYIDGRTTWSVRVKVHVDQGFRFGDNGMVSVWTARDGEVVQFGVGHLRIDSADSSGFMGGTVHGVGELGRR